MTGPKKKPEKPLKPKKNIKHDIPELHMDLRIPEPKEPRFQVDEDDQP